MESGEAEFVGMGRTGCWNEKKLELRLGPPGEEEEENWCMEAPVKQMDHESLLLLGPFKTSSFWTEQQQPKLSPSSSSFLDLSESCGAKVLDFHNSEKKAPAKSAVRSNSQKRTAPAPAPAPVVGWPPIRSSRRNLASKQASESPKPNAVLHKACTEAASGNGKGLFVKINMDGVPIGRKVDLKAYDSYAKLSAAVDELFTGLLAASLSLAIQDYLPTPAQADSFTGETANKESGVKEITGILDESGEYTLVYEDNEGDRMLVGDVPWHMFVSTVTRLRVLKSSDVSGLSRKSASVSGSAPPYQS